MEMQRSFYERGFESRDVCPYHAVLCGVRDHGKADHNQYNPGSARLLPKGFFRYAGMRHACLRTSVRRRQAETTESNMSKILAFSAIAVTALVSVAILEAVQPAGAKDYEYCRQDYSSGMRQCGFDTMEQCVAMISGRGGGCMRDPF
jgi:Protein of unknown function (DUF3551)